MSSVFTCPRGHQWQIYSGALPADTNANFLCPVCSELDDLPPLPVEDDSGLSRLLARTPALPGPGIGQRDEPGNGARSVPAIAGYEVLGLLGRGGMAVVYRARQTRLKRMVALKMVLAGPHAGAEPVARFRSEAEAVARLRDPHIVQIYEIGEQDGRPYLALELVDGGSLAQHLTGTPLPPRPAAQLVATLARSMHYAHQQGIIHRDLKPSNILLRSEELHERGEGPGARGEGENNDSSLAPGPWPLAPWPSPQAPTPMITDFGLAKLLDPQGGGAALDGRTQTGAILGTPSYMAPEQAAGAVHQIGPATDVYALGAILYETLTGRPPFRAATVLETLDQVRDQEPVPPSRLQPHLPRDLSTICLKCLAKQPERRYASAVDLADDLEHFLRGEPIRARPVSKWERVRKWARRRPAAAALAAVSLLASVSLLSGGLVYHSLLRNALRESVRHQERADANYQQARHTIDEMLARLGKFNAPDVPQVETLRRELCQTALAFFEEIAKAEPDLDPATRLDVARACLQMPNVQLDQAIGRASLDRARTLLEGLVAEDPENLMYQAELAQCLDRLAQFPPADQSRQFREQALAIRQKLCHLQPGNASWQRNLAVSHTNVGHGLYGTGNLAAAETHWREAVRIQEGLVRDYPEAMTFQHLLAISYANLALLFTSTKREALAEVPLLKSDALLTTLAKDHPENKALAWDLCATLRILGGLQIRPGKEEKARATFTRAIATAERLVREDPQSTGNKELVLVCLVGRMRCCVLLHRLEEDEKDWQRGLALSGELKTWTDLCEVVRDHARVGAPGIATARADRLAREQGLEDGDRFELAKAYSLASAAVRQDRSLLTTEREEKAEHHTAAAIALLTQLKQHGYFKDPSAQARLEKDEDLNPLRGRLGFNKLLPTSQASSR